MANEIVLRPSYWASVSGGKDSLYMLKLILENQHIYQLDGVVHFELEIDYPFIKTVIDYMETECTKHGIKFVRIKPRVSWIDLYNKKGYPDRVNRWCNHNYKLDAKHQLEKFLKSQNSYLVSYIGLCADEVKRFKNDKTVIYPLVDFGINEINILNWAKTQPIFNDYYKYNKRCGCMGCPLSSINETVYLKKYYPNEYNMLMKLALQTEKEKAKQLGKEKFSVWQTNPKYNTEYRMKRVDEIINGTYDFNKKGKTDLWKII